MTEAVSILCPDCRVPLEPSLLAVDPESRVCPGCGVDALALRMQRIAGSAMVWDYREVRLYLRWSELPPPVAELNAAKRLVPALKRVAHAVLGALVGQEPAWLVGEMPCQDARQLFVRARQVGLVPELVYLPEIRGTSQDPNAHAESEE